MGFYLTKAKKDNMAHAISQQIDFERVLMDNNGIPQYLSLDHMIEMAERESNELEHRILTTLMSAFRIHNSRN